MTSQKVETLYFKLTKSDRLFLLEVGNNKKENLLHLHNLLEKGLCEKIIIEVTR